MASDIIGADGVVASGGMGIGGVVAPGIIGAGSTHEGGPPTDGGKGCMVAQLGRLTHGCWAKEINGTLI